MQPVRLYFDYPKGFAKRFGMNSLYAGKHWAVRKADADFWHNAVALALHKQNIRRRCFEKPVEITFYWDDRLDLSNAAYAAKCIEDGLKGWIITDDSKRYVKAIHHLMHCKKCILVEISET